MENLLRQSDKQNVMNIKVLTLLLLLPCNSMAGGGTAGSNCEFYEKIPPEQSENTIDGCKDREMEADMLQCGYKNKWDNLGISREEVLSADYCMRKRGYRYKNSPNQIPYCDEDPPHFGCEEAIRKYKKSNVEVVN